LTLVYDPPSNHLSKHLDGRAVIHRDRHPGSAALWPRPAELQHPDALWRSRPGPRGRGYCGRVPRPFRSLFPLGWSRLLGGARGRGGPIADGTCHPV